ncbi:MAG: RNA polymerase sigma factor [Cyclobacteriaceae bacterium]|nr:RNA polymerase sigma factor [Cyclobacteriaceae bacterium]
MKDTIEDAELIAEALNGEMASFKTLVNRYEGEVAGVVKSMLGDSPEAMDVGQEVFIRFYESMKKFKGESALGTYLVRIAINLSLNEIKRRKKRQNVLRPLEDGRFARSVDDDHDMTEVVQHEIRQLDPDFRAVVSLRMIEGYTTEETAAILNVPMGTVLSRLFRAQKKLKTVLSKFVTS